VTFLFVCEISRGTAEWIFVRFTGKTCLVPISGQQLSTSCCTTLPAQYVWLPDLFSARPTVWNSLPILSGTRPSVQTVSDACLRRVCLLDTSALSALEVIDDYCAIQSYFLLNNDSLPGLCTGHCCCYFLYFHEFIIFQPTRKTPV